MRHPRELPGSTPRVAANVNSNVQSVNNSSMNSSVHVDIKNAREEPEVATPTLAPKEDKPEEPVRRAPLVETSAVADWQVVDGGSVCPLPFPAQATCKLLTHLIWVQL